MMKDQAVGGDVREVGQQEHDQGPQEGGVLRQGVHPEGGLREEVHQEGGMQELSFSSQEHDQGLQEDVVQVYIRREGNMKKYIRREGNKNHILAGWRQ